MSAYDPNRTRYAIENLFFVLSKMFGFLTVPFNLVVIIGLLSVALMRSLSATRA